jgi:hypothetical protein
MGPSKPKRRDRTIGRRESGSYVTVPHAVLNSSAFLDLPSYGVKLLFDIAAQYKGNNNGDLFATWTRLQKRGWKSRDTFNKALNALLDHGLIQKTRQGGLHRCSLYGLTWHPIHECNGKLEVQATRVASGLWKDYVAQPGKIKTPTRSACQNDTAGVSMDAGGLPVGTPDVLIEEKSRAA